MALRQQDHPDASPIQPFSQIDPENSPEDVAQSNAKLRFSSQSALPA